MAEGIEEQVSQATPVDLDELNTSLLAEDVEIDTDANPMEGPPPPADGVYRVKIEVDPKNFTMNKTKQKAGSTDEPKPYIAVVATAEVVDDGPYLGRKYTIRENTLVFNKKNRLVYIILQALGGAKNPAAVEYVKTLTNFGKIATGFRDTFAVPRVVKIKSEWAAQYKTGKVVNGRDEYKILLTGMKNFKPLAGGGFSHKIASPVGEVAARAEIRDYYPDEA